LKWYILLFLFCCGLKQLSFWYQAIRKSWVATSARLLDLCKTIDRRQWSFEHPLAQLPLIEYDIVTKLSRTNTSLEAMRDMDANEIGTKCLFSCDL